jgi:hypothetical protein
MPTALDNGQRSPRELLRAVIAWLLGRQATPTARSRRPLRGQITGTISLSITAPDLCPKGQIERLISASYTDI